MALSSSTKPLKELKREGKLSRHRRFTAVTVDRSTKSDRPRLADKQRDAVFCQQEQASVRLNRSQVSSVRYSNACASIMVPEHSNFSCMVRACQTAAFRVLQLLQQRVQMPGETCLHLHSQNSRISSTPLGWQRLPTR